MYIHGYGKNYGTLCHILAHDFYTYPDGGVTPAGGEDVDGWVNVDSVDCAQVTMVVTDHFVVFQIPAFHLERHFSVIDNKYRDL